MTQDASITIGELEANYQLYCKALKMLIPCITVCRVITNRPNISMHS